MNLLKRVNHILRAPTANGPQHESAWWVGLLATTMPVCLLALSGMLVMQSDAMAQRREGDAAVQREGGRRSPEGIAGPRRSAEGAARREGDANREGASEGRMRSREMATGLGDFRPQTDRELMLVETIRQLEREVAQLRRGAAGRRDGEQPARGDRQREVSQPDDVARDSDADRFELPQRWQSSKEGRVFEAYDKNRDGIVSLEEWLAMTNGNITPERRDLQTQRFNEAEPSGDGKFTPAEFIYWYSRGRFAGTRENERRGTDKPLEASERRKTNEREDGRAEGNSESGKQGSRE